MAGSDRALTFSGKPGCMLSPGVERVSDPVDLKVAALSDLAVSLYFPGRDRAGHQSRHRLAHHLHFRRGRFHRAGGHRRARKTSLAYYYLAAIDVEAPAEAAALVTFGDSITDGTASTPNSNHSWPALLAARLANNKKTNMIGVVEHGNQRQSRAL